MKTLFTSLLLVLFLVGCKNDKPIPPKPVAKPVSILEKIATAHGYEQWQQVKKMSFTFNVDRADNHYERSWQWQPKTNTVLHKSGTDSLQYNRNTMDSLALKTNAGFINDRYWLLAPFNLIWDQNNFTYEHLPTAKAPISGEDMQKLTIVYGNEGGYTPGDAYDFYFKEDHIIKEWVFRKANQAEPSLTTTWENHQNFNGIIIAIDHKKEDGSFNLFFDGIKIE